MKPVLRFQSQLPWVLTHLGQNHARGFRFRERRAAQRSGAAAENQPRPGIAPRGGKSPLPEAVMMALAEKIGRGAAHDLVYGACRTALDRGTLLLDELRAMPDVTKVADDGTLRRLCDPAQYLGSADAIISRALAAHRTP